jgi:multiple sugar transport system permease protein
MSTSTTASSPRTVRPAPASARPRRRTRPGDVAVVVLMCVLSLAWLVPVVAALYTSLRPFDALVRNGFWSLDGQLSLQNYVAVLEQGGSRFLLNSFLITLPALALALALASMAAFVLSRWDIPGARWIVMFMLVGNLLPQQVLIIPYFRLAERLGIFDTHLAVILAHAGFQLGFFTFVLYNFMRRIPVEIFEAARIDGAGVFTMLVRVLLPTLRPALAALATLGFTWIFNDLLFALALLRDTTKMPVTAGLLQLQGQFVTNWPLLSAAAVIGAIPTVLVFVVLQRQFVAGLTVGGGK